ncbi:MAG: uncharacterized protein KVP18_002410 [Porospora cf. gigantea A]|uniref:uncharacterized protein n=1 Tax=Porospora cf. gigantea A TaxID=2853593 RepID=UPI00355A94E2|nr:MAG: hypothetical protein KVP18_002410 [Porospora cf. gigantea A]
MLQVSNAEHGALFAVDRVAGEIICFLGHERCVGLRLELDHSLFRKSYETQRPQSMQYNSPTVDCHHLNLDYDTRSGIESRFCCVVPFANSAGTVEALAILVNRHNSRLPMTIHDFSRSLSCLSPDRGHWVGNDRMFDLRKVLPHVGRGANYYSRQEEFVLGALAKETSKSGGSSVLSRLSLSAIWRSEQQTSGTSFLSHVFPEAPKTSRPSTGYRTYRHSIMTDPDNYMDDLTRMEQHRKATFKDVETLGTPRLAAFAANGRSRAPRHTAVLVSSSLDGLRSFSSASMPVEMEQTPNLGSSPQSTSPLLHRRLTFDFERLKPVVGEFDVDWWALNTQDMYVIFSFIMADVGCLSNFTITPDLLQKFFLANAAGYHISNPYHNFFHAMQTTHCAYLFLTKFNLIDYLSDIHTLSLLLAALSHDINHPGVNNGMLISMRHPISDLYNDLSCLEMHHAAYVWRNILSKKQTNVLVNLSTDDFKLFRKNHVNAILSEATEGSSPRHRHEFPPKAAVVFQ